MPKRLGQHQPNGSKWIKPVKRLAIYLRDGFTCLYCGEDLRDEKPADVTLDHLVSKEEWFTLHGHYVGVNHETNLVTACRSCNSSRGSKPWREYAPGGAVERIVATITKPLNKELARAIMEGRAGAPDLEVG
jgi:5-methylcytosine-specific restriction endonuclease McrA